MRVARESPLLAVRKTAGISTSIRGVDFIASRGSVNYLSHFLFLSSGPGIQLSSRIFQLRIHLIQRIHMLTGAPSGGPGGSFHC